VTKRATHEAIDDNARDKSMNQKIIILVTAIAILPFVQLAKAQQPAGKVPRIAYLTFGSSSSSAPRREAFREGLRKLNYIEGQNIIVEYRYADSKADLLAEQIAELIQLKVDVIVAGGTQANVEVKKATSTIPIVIANSDDPLGSGLVESLAPRRQCHRIVFHVPRAKWQTTGVVQRGLSKGSPPGGSLAQHK